MPFLVAAATDQTGRTITMLSAGLVAVAFGLAVLTIWYWRFTSPKRRIAATRSAAENRPVAEERRPVAGEHRSVAEEPRPVHELPQVEAPVVQQGDEPDLAAEPETVSSSDHGGASIGLDSDQWALLTQAVMDEYLDS